MQQNDLQTVKGTVKTVTFYNPSNGYSVLKIIQDKDKSALLTVTGCIPEVKAGETIVANGTYVNHPKYGRQFSASDIHLPIPETAEGIYSLLARGFLPGIKKGMAKKLVDAFGENFFDVLDNQPEMLLEVKGISENKLKKILHAYKQKMGERKAFAACTQIGMTLKLAEKLYDRYGDGLVAMIYQKPYDLVSVKGISFKTADWIASRTGVDLASPSRIREGIFFALDESMNLGNCGYPKDKLLDEAAKILGLSPETVVPVLQEILQNNRDIFFEDDRRRIVEDKIYGTSCLFPKYMHDAETRAAEHLHKILYYTYPSARLPEDADRAIHEAVLREKAEKGPDFELDPDQAKAVKMALEDNLLIITGGPGVGKTTIIETILDIYEAYGNTILLAAPTGRAAKRMFESTHREAKTIHRLLEYSPEEFYSSDRDKTPFGRNETNPLEGDLLIVDESSMIDSQLFDNILRAVPDSMRVIFVGDVDQLPSVGAGQVLRDMIESKKIPVARLTKIFRQARKSKIIRASHEINDGICPSLKNHVGDDFFFFPAEDPQDCVRKILALACKEVPERLHYDAIKDIQILCPMKAGAMGTVAMNINLQYQLNNDAQIEIRKKNLAEKRRLEKRNPDAPKLTGEEAEFLLRYRHHQKGLTFRDMTLYPGDKVMQIRNNYQKKVFNGDIGYVSAIDSESHAIRVDFDNGANSVEYKQEELGQLMLAYACTVHKSQGSEYPVVIIPVMTNHFVMLQRKLFYTGVTRGKKMVILVGQEKAMRMAVKGKLMEFNRWTKLKECIEERC